jgi:hypothetical protein
MCFLVFSSFLHKLVFQRFKNQLKSLPFISVFDFSTFLLKKLTQKQIGPYSSLERSVAMWAGISHLMLLLCCGRRERCRKASYYLFLINRHHSAASVWRPVRRSRDRTPAGKARLNRAYHQARGYLAKPVAPPSWHSKTLCSEDTSTYVRHLSTA